MSLLDRFRALMRFFPGRQDDSTTTVRIGNSGSTPAGVYVDSDTALQNATVWACLGYLSRTVAQLPWRVMQEQESGESAPRRVPRHPLQYLLATRPNPEMTAFAFKETLVMWAARAGNGVAEIQFDGRGVPTALWPMHPSRVTFERDTDTGGLAYGISQTDGTRRYLPPSNVFHLRGFGEGAVGLDVVTYAAQSIGWARATELFGSTFFGNGLNPSGFLKYGAGRLQPGTKEAVEAELNAKHRGARKGNRTMILDGSWDYIKSQVEPDSAQFIETRQHQVEEICRWFGVPPHKVMHLLRATFSNIEHQSIEVVVDCITPWCLRLEQEADFKLFGPANRQAFFTKLDLKGLLRGDFKSRQEGLQLMRRNGIINANEWRRLEDMDEIGDQGDTYIVETNMTTLERVGEKPAAPAAAAAPAAEPADTTDTTPPEPTSAVDRARRQAQRAGLLH